MSGYTIYLNEDYIKYDYCPEFYEHLAECKEGWLKPYKNITPFNLTRRKVTQRNRESRGLSPFPILG